MQFKKNPEEIRYSPYSKSTPYISNIKLRNGFEKETIHNNLVGYFFYEKNVRTES
jgi:hypothetical protein